MSDYNFPFMFDVNFSFGADSIFTVVDRNEDNNPPLPREILFLLLEGNDFLLLNGQNLILL